MLLGNYINQIPFWRVHITHIWSRKRSCDDPVLWCWLANKPNLHQVWRTTHFLPRCPDNHLLKAKGTHLWWWRCSRPGNQYTNALCHHVFGWVLVLKPILRLDSWITPASSIVFKCASSSPGKQAGVRRIRCFIGLASPVSMLCSRWVKEPRSNSLVAKTLWYSISKF